MVSSKNMLPKQLELNLSGNILYNRDKVRACIGVVKTMLNFSSNKKAQLHIARGFALIHLLFGHKKKTQEYIGEIFYLRAGKNYLPTKTIKSYKGMGYKFHVSFVPIQVQ